MAFTLKRFLLLAFALVATVSPDSGWAQQLGSVEYSTHIMSAFRQGSGSWLNKVGNCASVAVIKAAMATFGIEGVLQNDPPPVEGIHTVLLRNRVTVVLTDQEIAEAGSKSLFIPPDPSDGPGDPAILNRAKYLYAVMAKQAVAVHSDSSLPFGKAKNFNAALGSLRKGGIDADKLTELLGLDTQEAVVSGPVAYVHANWVHAVFATGSTFDQYAEPKPLSQFDSLHEPGSNHLTEEDKTNFIVVEQKIHLPT